jgi:ribonucleoside-diphosphate reductase alpha chain
MNHPTPNPASCPIPNPEVLSALFDREIDENDQDLLIQWEEDVRTRVLQNVETPVRVPHRWHLPEVRPSITHHFSIHADGEPITGYLTTGLYPNGRVGEVFLRVAKEGTFLCGIMNALTQAVSVGLQHGIPLQTYTDQFKYTKFEPSGMVEGAPGPLRGFAKSILDYMGRYLEARFPHGQLPRLEKANAAAKAAQTTQA